MKKPSLKKLKPKAGNSFLKKQLNKLPSNSRSIPEDKFNFAFLRLGFNKALKLWSLIIIGLLSFSLLILVVFLALDLYKDYKGLDGIEKRRGLLKEEISYWDGVVQKHSDYRDAYFKLAVLEYQLGDTSKAGFYLDRTLKLDPNFDEAKKLRKVLSN